MTDRIKNIAERLLRVTLRTTAVGCISYFAALLLRFELTPENFPSGISLYAPLLLAIFSRIFLYLAFAVDRRTLRSTSLIDLERLAIQHALSLVFVSFSILMLRIEGVSRSVLILDAILSFLCSTSVRVAVRQFFEWKRLKAISIPKATTSTLICGAGISGNLILRNLQAHPELGLQPIGILDDDSRLKNTILHGVPVLGKLSALSEVLAQRPEIKLIVLAIPSLPYNRVKEIESLALANGVRFRTLSKSQDALLERILGSRGDSSVEELLGKLEDWDFSSDVKKSFKGQTVLVTGGAGSIGSEICAQLVQLPIEHLIILDNSEYNVYKTQLNLKNSNLTAKISVEIADIRDSNRINAIFNSYHPHTVIHAAAYKHVPLMEMFPEECFKTNVIGTLNILKACKNSNISRFILISTDKAVSPCNVMGRCKRIAELLVLESAKKSPESHYSAVRFGNVINSIGSVIPLFREQILAGGPITVTHPEVERYFMSTKQAVRLVLSASTLKENGTLFILEMGQKLKIREVAEKLRLLLDRPEVPIVFTGLRQGERLTEEVNFKQEDLANTEIEGVYTLRNQNLDADIYVSVIKINENIDRLSKQQVLDEIGLLSGKY